METARSVSTCPPNLPLAPVDTDRRPSDGDSHHHDRHAPLVSATHSSAHQNQSQGRVSPYGQGLLSLAHLANAASKEFSNTPPDSRRASGEDKESSVTSAPAASQTRQSLPSISEALGIDNNASYQPVVSAAPATPSLLHSAKPTSSVSTMRTYAAEPPQPYADTYASKYGPPPTAPSTSFPTPDPSRAASSGLRPALHLHTPQSTAHPSSSNANHQHTLSNPSPAHDRPPPVVAPSTAPSTFTYGYTPYPPRYASSTNAGSAQYHGSSSSKTWEGGKGSPGYLSEKNYGESVKRHLDLYDLESALNDISSASNFLGDFARRYGDLLHQSPRAGLSLAALPGMIEIEDMIAKSRTQTEALIKISETVVARQAAHDERKAEMRQQAYHDDYDNGNDIDDMIKGPDAKKRRGRAAPPGRCHSCNRAETPEWRRGPDGARTLCNACGLHYAKLTRKAHTAGKSAAVSSSNLRPKENMP